MPNFILEMYSRILKSFQRRRARHNVFVSVMPEDMFKTINTILEVDEVANALELLENNIE